MTDGNKIGEDSSKETEVGENPTIVNKMEVENFRKCKCDVVGLTEKLRSIEEENEKLKKQITDLQERLSAAHGELLKIKRIEKVVEGTFSQCQQQAVIKVRCSNWSPNDIAKAATLRCISHKALGFARDVLKYPLPSEMTIKRRLRQFSVPPGFIDLSITILKTQATLLSNLETDVILSFDEMKVNSDLCFDHMEEIIRGPHNNVQVMVIRPLLGKWMQPIYYNFDTAVSVELLTETIKVIEETDFKVRGFVSDMGSSNRKLLSDLQVSWTRSFIENPAEENRKVWVFCDVPHALKLIRNHLLDEGYELESGKLFTKEPFVKLVELQSTGQDLQYAHKLTMNHLLVAGTERQNVRKAAELLSLTVGKALIHNFPEFSHVGEAAIIVNNGFDDLNSRIPIDAIYNLKSAYGTCLKEQDDALDKLYKLIHSMKVIAKRDRGKEDKEIEDGETNDEYFQMKRTSVSGKKNRRPSVPQVYDGLSLWEPFYP